MSESRRHDAIALGILTSLIALLFLDVLIGANSLYIRDLAFYYYPAKKILRDVVLGGEFPFWNPWFSAGQPFAANPEHEVFYPLTWLILLPSYDLGFRLLVVLHLAICAWTMYALLRSMRLGAPASFFGALSFALGGLVLSNLAFLPILFSIAWLPLTCLYTRRYLHEGKRRDLALAALFLGIQLLVGEPTTVLQTGLLLGMYALWRKNRARNVAAVAVICLLALLVSAAQTLPAIDHARDSVRARGFEFSVVSNWSMPLARAGEWLFPNLLGHQQLDGRKLYWGGSLYPGRGGPFLHSIYPGLLIAVLAIAGMLARIRGWGLVLVTTIVSIVLALGANTPLLRLLYDAGIARSVRYPEKFILLGIFALTVFGAVVLDRLLAGDEHVRRWTRTTLLAVTAIAAVFALIAFTPLFPPLFTRLWNPPAALLAQMLALARSGWVIAAAKGLLLLVILRRVVDPERRLPAGAPMVLLAVFVGLDLVMVVPELAPRVDSAFFRETPAVVRQLAPQRDAYRLFHQAGWQPTPVALRQAFGEQRDLYWINRNALFPMLPALYGLRTAIEVDFDLTALTPTADFTQSAWELARYRPDWADVAASMSNVWYGVTWGGGSPAIPVRVIELPRYPRYSFAERLEPIRNRHEFVAKLASNQFGPRTAFIYGDAFPPARGIVRRVAESANRARIDVETAGRAFLVISVTPHKYWTIIVDGAEAEAVVTNVGYQGVVVPAAGRHVVEMRYHNPLIVAGAALSLIGILALILCTTMRAL